MLVGRWHCNVVLLYTRTAPISDIAGDLKRARVSKTLPDQVLNMEKTFKNVKSMVDSSSAALHE